MGPYRTSSASSGRAFEKGVDSAESVIGWLLIVIGGGRAAQALLLAETWEAEATLCLAVLIVGVIELWSSTRK